MDVYGVADGRGRPGYMDTIMDDTKKTVGAIIPVPGNMLQAVLLNRFVDVDHLQSDWIMKGGLKVASAIYLLDWNSRYLYGFFSVSSPPAVAHSEYGKMIRIFFNQGPTLCAAPEAAYSAILKDNYVGLNPIQEEGLRKLLQQYVLQNSPSSSTPPGNPHPVQALPPQRNENIRSTQSQFRRPMNSDHRHPPTRVHSRHPPPVHEEPRQEIKQYSRGMYAPHQNNNIGDHQVAMNKQNSEQLTSSRTKPSEVNIASRMPQVDHKLYSQLDYRTGRSDEYQGIQKQDSGSSNWTGGHSSEGSTWHSKSAENNPLLHFSYETMGHFSVPRDHAPRLLPSEDHVDANPGGRLLEWDEETKPYKCPGKLDW